VESDAVLSTFAPVWWFRPGSGRFDARMLATLQRHGYRCALGSVYPFDPHIRWSWFSRRFIQTLSDVLPALRKRGLRVVTLTELTRLGEGR